MGGRKASWQGLVLVHEERRLLLHHGDDPGHEESGKVMNEAASDRQGDMRRHIKRGEGEIPPT